LEIKELKTSSMAYNKNEGEGRGEGEGGRGERREGEP
jgi:hypothetical protein